jgi:hypothetical protein
MPTMGQTFKGDLEGGAEMCEGGSLGPVGSPGWRRREAWGREVVRLRRGNWGAEMRVVARRKVVVVGDMVGGLEAV